MSDPTPTIWQELRGLVAPLYFPVLSITGSLAIALPLVPLYLEDAGVSLSMVGVITGAAGVGAALVGIPASAVAERYGNDQLLVVAAVAVASAVAQSPATMLTDAKS